LENYKVFLSGGMSAEKGVAVVWRNDIVKRITKVNMTTKK